MEVADLIKTFKKANSLSSWGEYTELVFFDDGSGEIRSEGEILYAFHDIDELVEKLREEGNSWNITSKKSLR